MPRLHTIRHRLAPVLARPAVRRLGLAGLFFVLVGIGVLGSGQPAGAFDPNIALANFTIGTIFSFLARVIFAIASLFSYLTLILINIFEQVANYNEFSKAAAVTEGWKVVRDVSNMFMVIILLVIAFGTVLRLQAYHYRQLIGKFVIFALLINFSKGIALFFIDIAQVVMATFISAFKGQFGPIFIDGLGFRNVFALEARLPEAAADAASMLTAMFTAVIMVIIFGTIFIYTAILLFRIIMLWFLLVLSPLPYVLGILPNTQNYASQWWTQFTKYLIVGPVLAFFLWLTLTVMAVNPLADKKGGVAQEVLGGDSVSSTVAGEFQNQDSGGVAYILSSIGQSENLMSFIIAVGMLFASLLITQSMGVVGGSMAGAWASKLQSAGISALKSPAKLAGYIERKIAANTGVAFNPVRMWQGFKGVLEQRKLQDERNVRIKGKERIAARKRAGKTMGLGGLMTMATATPEDFADQYLSWRGAASRVPAIWRKGSWEKMEQAKAEADKQKSFMGDESLSHDQRKDLWQQIDGQMASMKGALDESSNMDHDEATRKEFADLAEVRAKKIQELTAKAGDRSLSEGSAADMANILKEHKSQLTQFEKNAIKYENRASVEKMPAMYYSDQMRRAATAEEAKKIGTDNWHELLSGMQDALVSKDTGRFVALQAKMGVDGNRNEYLNYFVKDSGRAGVEKFRKEILMGRMGMGEDESMRVSSDMDTIDEKIKHYGTMRNYSLNARTGFMKFQDPDEWTEEVLAELSKLDVEKRGREVNRLGHGGELTMPDGTTQSYFSEPHFIDFLRNQKKIIKLIAANRYSPNSARNMTTSPIMVAQLEEAVRDGLIQKSDDGKGNMMTVIEALRDFAGKAEDELAGDEAQLFEAVRKIQARVGVKRDV